MKRHAFILPFLVLLLAILPEAALAAKKEVAYRAELDYPPYKYVQNNYLTGFDIDLTNRIFEKQTYRVDYRSEPWNKVYRQLVNGDIDTGGLMAVNADRARDILYSKPVMQTFISVYARPGFTGQVTLKNLGSYRIGVGKGQYTESVLLKKAGVSGYTAYPTVAEALDALTKGYIDLLFENQSVVDYLIVEEGLTGKIIHKLRNLYPADVAYGVSKDSAELIPYINKRLDLLQRDGTFEQLYQQYFFSHSDGYMDQKRYRAILWLAAAVLLMTVGILLLRIYIGRLRKGLRAEQRFTESIIEHTGVFVLAVREDRTVMRLNKLGEQVLGVSEAELIGRKLDEAAIIIPGASQIKELLHRAVAYHFVDRKELQIPENSPDGRFYLCRTTLIKELGGRDSDTFVLIGIDIDEQKRNELKLHSSYCKLEAANRELAHAQEELQEHNEKLGFSERRFRLAVEASGAYIWELEIDSWTYWVSERWYETMGFTEKGSDRSVESLLMLIHPDDREYSDRALYDHLAGRTPVYETEYRMRTEDGRYLWFEVRGKSIGDIGGGRSLFIGSLIDITHRKQIEFKLSNSYQELEATYEQLTATQHELMEHYDILLENQKEMHHLAYFDSLSHLPNRPYLLDAMEKYFLFPGGNAALLFVDTDNFKYINDTMGHKFGDILIRQMSERLQETLSGEGSMLSRLGGDEFVIFVKDVAGRDDVTRMAENIICEFKKPFSIGESSIYVSVSVGISFYPEDGGSTEEILKNADIAMYRAKEAGKGVYAVYDKSMQTEFSERMMIEKHLRSALDNAEFELYYQPQVEIATGSITGFEALIRWNSPELGFVSPLTFIQIAEDSRLIIPIGRWVLREACFFMKSVCRDRHHSYKISVNISVIQLLQDDFIDMLTEILEESGMSPECLELEITESVFIESYERTIAKLNELRSRGIRIALDDFGTGYSSLSYLQQLPISTLKMDKTFIDPLPGDPFSQSFIRTMVSLGHEIGLEVVAEGVEDKEQLAFLKDSGCDMVQGYLISRPLSRQHTEAFIRQQSGGWV